MPFIETSTANLYYEQVGAQGDAILFIQGVGVIGKGWKPQFDDLAKNFVTVSFDNRGIGQSTEKGSERLSIEQMAEDARELMAALGFQTYHVVGHSMGGVIAQRLAIDHGQRVKSLSLLCTVARGADATRMSVKMIMQALRMRVGSRAQRRRAFLQLIYPKGLHSSAELDQLALELAPLFGRDLADQPPILFRQAMALRRHDCTADLPKLHLPTLIVSAVHDPIASVDDGRALHHLIHGSQFVEFPNASHGVPIQQADEVNRLLEKFIRSTEEKK